MGEIRFLNLASDNELVKCIQKKEREHNNNLSEQNIKKHLDRVDNIIIKIINEINIRKGHNPYKHGLDLIRDAQKVAQLMNCSNEKVKMIGLAAYLHDIGKSEIDRDILNKPGQLTSCEFKKIQKHVLYGKQIVMPFTYIGNLIYCHHEKWDGSGYLEKMKGNDIPLGSRIISIIDAFNAITHSRIYDPARPLELAFNELKRCSGLEFDERYTKNFTLSFLKRLSEGSTAEEYKQKILAILCKKGEFNYNEEIKKTIEEIEKDYLQTRLRSEEQFDKLTVACFLSILDFKNKNNKRVPRFGYIEIRP